MEEDILNYALEMGCKELHMSVDEETDLKAIIAIHSTALGPALGGCRLIEYPTTHSAVVDAIRLAQGMTYKAAISNLPLGGGKMVVMKPKIIKDRVAFFKKIGKVVDALNGRYITAVDSGTSIEDMDIVATTTPHVTSTTQCSFTFADPSVLTARGVLRGIQAAVKYKVGKETLKDVHVLIQGLGHAGYHLAKELHAVGAKLSVYDIKPEAVSRCVKEFNAKAIPDFETLIRTPAEVFAPSALGAILNDDTIPALQAGIIAGCANNQLENPRHGKMLMERGILYAPDYVVNAGGLIYVAAQYSHITEALAKQNIEAIYDVLIRIFERSDREQKPTNLIADEIAKEKVAQKEKKIELEKTIT